MPWVSDKRSLTEGTAWFLAAWAKWLSWNEVARVFRATWDQVFSSVEMAVRWGREHRGLEGIEAIGVDEIAWQRGHRYLTLVYQIDAGCRRLLWQAQHRGYGLVRRVRPGRYCASFVGWAGNERKHYAMSVAICRSLILKSLRRRRAMRCISWIVFTS